MEFECSLPSLQQAAIGSYPQPVESIPRPPIVFLNINFYSYYPLFTPISGYVSFPSGFTTTTLHTRISLASSSAYPRSFVQ